MHVILLEMHVLFAELMTIAVVDVQNASPQDRDLGLLCDGFG